MKLIIDIPDNDYRQIKECYEKNDIVEALYSYIYYGTPLEQEPTTKNDLRVDCIVDVLGSYTDLDIPYKREIAENILTKLPSVTPQEPKTGHWIIHHESITLLTGETATGGVVCSKCGYKTHNKAHVLIGCPYKYCPDCGTKMVEPQEVRDKE